MVLQTFHNNICVLAVNVYFSFRMVKHQQLAEWVQRNAWIPRWGMVKQTPEPIYRDVEHKVADIWAI